jgi:hypothetical protein
MHALTLMRPWETRAMYVDPFQTKISDEISGSYNGDHKNETRHSFLRTSDEVRPWVNDSRHWHTLSSLVTERLFDTGFTNIEATSPGHFKFQYNGIPRSLKYLTNAVDNTRCAVAMKNCSTVVSTMVTIGVGMDREEQFEWLRASSCRGEVRLVSKKRWERFFFDGTQALVDVQTVDYPVKDTLAGSNSVVRMMSVDASKLPPRPSLSGPTCPGVHHCV